ncbi:hypothetical protein Q3G72_005128 [Acer saccharum]|nr:hypothetical protein Q3G72_005128 [Acer saccharum]
MPRPSNKTKWCSQVTYSFSKNFKQAPVAQRSARKRQRSSMAKSMHAAQHTKLHAIAQLLTDGAWARGGARIISRLQAPLGACKSIAQKPSAVGAGETGLGAVSVPLGAVARDLQDAASNCCTNAAYAPSRPKHAQPWFLAAPHAHGRNGRLENKS